MQGVEYLVEETMLPDKQLVHSRQEYPRLGPLDHSVVVCGGEHDYLRNPQLSHGTGVRGGKLRRIGERPDADDGTLARHETRNGLRRTERARVRDRDRRARKVLDRELVGPDLAHEVLVGMEPPREVELVCPFDARHEERP